MESQAWWNITNRFADYDFDLDLNKYFERINYSGTTDVTLENLKLLMFQHLISVPFENLDIQLSKGININPHQVYRKIVENKRGGYCFEQNNLMFYVLRKLGYEVTPMIARVLIDLPPNMPSSKLHMILKVSLDQIDFLVDVGFGTQCQIAPLDIRSGLNQQSSHDVRRIIVGPGGYFIHQLKIGEDKYLDMYKFKDEEVMPIDCELGNWVVSTHPESIFTKYLFLGSIDENYRYFLLNYQFKSRDKDGVSQEFDIQPEELLDYLRKYFHLDFPAETTFKRLEQLKQT